MFVTKKHLSRRTVLRGMGATVALPLARCDDSGAHRARAHGRRAARRSSASSTSRTARSWSKWTPAAEGKSFELPPLLEPLAPFKDQLTIVSGLENKHASGPTHAITPGTWLSGVSPRISHDPYGGVTADQIAAQHIGQDTPLPSLEVATEEAVGGGACDRNYGCSYGATISFRTPSTPLPMEFNPRKLFQRLFGQGDTPEERELLAAQYASILDVVAGKAAALQKVVGPSRPADARTTISRACARSSAACRRWRRTTCRTSRLPDAPVGIPSSFDEQMNLMFDTVALAWTGEPHAHHVVHDGGRGQQHDLQPRRGSRRVPRAVASSEQRREARAVAARADSITSRAFARFVQKLKDTPDGDGSMLDHSLLVYGSNMSNSNAHDHFPLPMALRRRRAAAP